MHSKYFKASKKTLIDSAAIKKNETAEKVNNYRVFDEPVLVEKESITSDSNFSIDLSEEKNNKIEINNIQEEKVIIDNELHVEYKKNKNTEPTIYNFSSLVGLQRRIILYMFEICKILRSKVTSPLSSEHIATNLNATKCSVQKTIQRLEKHNILIRNSFKQGRGGWTKYELPDAIFQEMIHEETINKLLTNLDSPSNKSDIVISETKNNEKLKKLSDEWESVDIEPLKYIGFSITHLTQIADQGKLAVEVVQDSIYAFCYDLEYNKKIESIKGSPLNYFMGIIRNGKPYAPPSGYESPQDLAMRVYLERKKEVTDIREAREKELMNSFFIEWESSLSDEDKLAFVPEHERNRSGPGSTAIKKSFVRPYFEKNIWPEERKKLLNSL